MILKHTPCFRPVFAAAAWLLLAAPTSAHHSYAMFELDRTLSAEGVVAKVEWVNPHVFVWVYVPNAEGGHDLFAFETDPVSRLAAEGWAEDSLPPGEGVTIEYAPLRDGRNGGALLRATRSDGLVLETRASRGRT